MDTPLWKSLGLALRLTRHRTVVRVQDTPPSGAEQPRKISSLEDRASAKSKSTS